MWSGCSCSSPSTCGAAGARPTSEAPAQLLTDAAAGRCPRCHARTLFAGLVRFAPRCRACGLDFAGFNVGDGPAAFLILVIGALIVGLAIALELAASPPVWLHILLWPPITAIAVLAALRLSKGILIALEYRHSAREGGISGDER